MMRRSLSVVACFSLLACGNLRAMEKNAAAKKTASIENTAAEKQKNLKLLKEKIEGCDKTFAQIQTLAAGMDKDAAANICVREYKKIFEILPEVLGGEVNVFFEKLVDGINNPLIPSPSIEPFMLEVFSKIANIIPKYAQESLYSEACTFVLYPEIGADFINVSIKTGMEKMSQDMVLALKKIKKSEIIERGANVLTASFISVFRDSMKVTTQAMANELAKHYDIDFEALGLEEPK